MSKEQKTRTKVLSEANDLVTGQRSIDYGGNHWDSSCDGAGYLALGAEVAEDEG